MEAVKTSAKIKLIFNLGIEKGTGNMTYKSQQKKKNLCPKTVFETDKLKVARFSTTFSHDNDTR